MKGSDRLLALMALVALVISVCVGQGMDDAGGNEDSGGQDDLSSSDPSLVNPSNKQGYGRDVPTQLVEMNGGGSKNRGGKGGSSKKDSKSNAQSMPTMAEQTIQAALQFGVLVAVALLVGILFFLNIGLDLFLDALKEKLSSAFGDRKEVDIEDQDPASLVGTFKRYK